MLGREWQGTLIGTRRQWVRAVAEDDHLNVALTFPGGEDSARSVTNGEQTESVATGVVFRSGEDETV